jgi:amidase
MRFEEYRKHDAVSLAGLIAKRQVSAEEVLEAAIARAEQVNPALNAIVHKQYEQARKAVATGPASRQPSAAACSRILSPITRPPM